MGRSNANLSKTGKDPVMQWDRQTLTALGGIAAILIGSAMLFEDAALSLGPIGAIVGGIAATALAGLDRLKQRIATLEKRFGTRQSRVRGRVRRAVLSRHRPIVDRAIARSGMRRRRTSLPCRQALIAWSSPAGANPRR
jgi:hypothetical protein